MKILYLYAEIMGYNIPVLNILSKKYYSEVTVVSWKKKISSYKIDFALESINFHFKEDFEKDSLKSFCISFNPDIVVVSGWMDKDYLKICKLLKKISNTIIVAASDTQWSNSFKHNLATCIAPFYHRKMIDFLWVSGAWQYEYARRLGFSNQKIIFNCYSANIDIFNKNMININQNRTLLFLGRFEKVKGIDLLLKSFIQFKEETNSTLKLKFIGGGVELDLVNTFKSDDIIVKDFIQPNQLVYELNDVTGFILPSINEPWGLVIHEMASAGLPLLLTDICGANTMFAINNYNALLFKPNSKEALLNVLKKYDNLSNEQILEMGQNSKFLSNRITPEISAASLMSIINT